MSVTLGRSVMFDIREECFPFRIQAGIAILGKNKKKKKEKRILTQT